jgi:hypothetical protein
MQATPALNNWRMFCETEDTIVQWWLPVTTPQPTQCPTNSAHTILPNSTFINNVQATNEVVIKECNNPNIGGNFRATGFSITAAASSSITSSVSWPWPVCLFTATFNTSEDLLGDRLQADLAPNTVIGALSANCAAAATTISVSAAIIAIVNIGYLISLSDGTNTDNLGAVLAIDSVNNILTVQTPTVHAFGAATPTYVQMTIRFVENFIIGHAGPHQIGGTMIGGTSLPANTAIVITYTNTSSSNAHTVSGYFDYRF